MLLGSAGQVREGVDTERERAGVSSRAVRNLRRKLEFFSRPPTRFLSKVGERSRTGEGNGSSTIWGTWSSEFTTCSKVVPPPREE